MFLSLVETYAAESFQILEAVVKKMAACLVEVSLEEERTLRCLHPHLILLRTVPRWAEIQTPSAASWLYCLGLSLLPPAQSECVCGMSVCVVCMCVLYACMHASGGTPLIN